MLSHWTRKVPGAPWVRQVRHGTWLIAQLGDDRAVELRYASLDQNGRLPTVPLPLGEFESVFEAMLAVDLYEARPTPAMSENHVQALLAEPGGKLSLPAPSGTRLLLGHSPEGVWLGIAKLEMPMTVVAIMRPPRLSAAGNSVHGRPPGHEDPTELDIRIMAEILEVRRRRASGLVEAPMCEDEYDGWRDHALHLPATRQIF